MHEDLFSPCTCSYRGVWILGLVSGNEGMSSKIFKNNVDEKVKLKTNLETEDSILDHFPVFQNKIHKDPRECELYIIQRTNTSINK